MSKHLTIIAKPTHDCNLKCKYCYLVVHEVTKNSSRIMDCGPSDANPNRIISKKRLEDSWMQTPMDYGIIFV
jgi:sulfatase maturation enzyme AslB (radical SAM superfamily)